MRSSWPTRPTAWLSHRVSIVTLVIACALIAAGVALATIPDANGVLHGCYGPLGNLRLIDSPGTSCRALETAVAWNVTGPAGPTGATGQRGPSDAFLKDQRNQFGSVNISGADFIPIVTLSLPPGNYIANATAAFASEDTVLTRAQCAIRGSISSFLSTAVQGTIEAQSTLVLPLTTAFTLTAADDVSLVCRGTGSLVFTQPSAITAIQVATLTVQ